MVLIFLMLPFAANIVIPPPLDMAKEAICALLAIFGRFFGVFLPRAHGQRGRRAGEVAGGQAGCKAEPARPGVGGKQVDSRLESEGNPGRKTRPGRTATTGRTAMTGRKPGESQERPAQSASRPLSGANEAADGERQCLRKFHLELSLLISNLPSAGVLSAMEMSAYFSSVPGTLLGIMR